MHGVYRIRWKVFSGRNTGNRRAGQLFGEWTRSKERPPLRYGDRCLLTGLLRAETKEINDERGWSQYKITVDPQKSGILERGKGSRVM